MRSFGNAGNALWGVLNDFAVLYTSGSGLYAASGLAGDDFALDTAFFLVAFFFVVGGVVVIEADACVNSAFFDFAFDNVPFFDDLVVVVVGVVANESVAFNDSAFDVLFVVFFLFVGGMGEDDCDGGSTVSIVRDDDAFLDLLDLVSRAGDLGSGFFFGPFFAFAFVDAMIA